MSRLMKTMFWILTALVLSHCGEPFRAQEMSSQDLQPNSSQGQQTYFNQEGFRIPIPTQNNHTSADEDILRRYGQLLEGREAQTQALTQEIQAFDFIIAPQSSSQVQIQARVHFSCSNRVEFQGEASLQGLLSNDGVEVNSNSSNMSMRAHCADQSCRQMVVSLSRQSEQGLATVLIGLAANTQQSTGVGYMSRQVAHTPYFAHFHSGAHFQQMNNCTNNQDSSSESPVNQLFGVIQERATDYIVDQANNFLQMLFN